MKSESNNNWKIKALGDISIISMGQSPSSSSYNEEGNGSYLIQGNADIKDRKSLPRQWTSEPTKFCDFGDTLMTVRAPVGAIAKSMHNACIGRGICSIKAKDVDSEYLYQFLLSYESKWKSLEQGSTFTAVNGDDIRGIQIPIPPLLEQQKIAEILSTVDDKIDVIDQQISETQTLKKGLMQRLLTKGIGHTEFKDSPLGEIPKSWEVVKQTEVATFFNGRAYKLTEWEHVGTPVIRLQNLTGTGKDYYYSRLELPDHQYCYNGDLLYMWSATFGPVWWFGGKAIYHYHIWKIEHDTKRLNKKFHYYLLDSVTTRMKNESHGSTMLHVTKGGMEKLPIQLPSLPEQLKIAEILSSVDEKIEVLEDKKTHYQELKQGLMQQLLTGKIRVAV